MDETVGLTIHPVKDTWAVFSLGLLLIKLLRTGFCETINFHFLGIKVQEYGKCMFVFVGN